MAFVETRTEILVTPGESTKRLDHFLANRDPNFSRTALQRLILGGHITVEGQPVKPSHKIKPGDRILLIVPRPEPLEIEPEAIPIQVLYEDESLLAVNKQAGLVVHPAPGHWSGTLVNALLYHLKTSEAGLSTIGGRERPGLVHRLDKDTTGVLVVAKDDHAHRVLSAQFKRHSITRVYEAVVWGKPKTTEGRIELAIGRDTKDRKKFSARTTRPKESLTQYRVLERFGKLASHLELIPGTGRTHQLRVHLSALHCPILGDITYGGKKVMEVGGVIVPRVMLHAKVLGFIHPVTEQEVLLKAPLPEDIVGVTTALQQVTASV
ncbi:MAG: RluA family pseudouridine synthase [Nitrospirales bacterium]|nr:RluA family pseudouridine synthase [Nitrospira sp.]MDR4500892.1 RluA family pseudouridine synthase [Nitrospirales bacterium]